MAAAFVSSNLFDANQWITKYQLMHDQLYIKRINPSLVQNQVPSLDRFRFKFEEKCDCPVPYDGVPFVVLGTEAWHCYYNKDRRPSEEKQKDKPTNLTVHGGKDEDEACFVTRKGTKRRLGSPAVTPVKSSSKKKFECPAKIRVKKIIKFPEYGIDHDGPGMRNQALSCLKRGFHKDVTVQESQVFVFIEGNHSGHPDNENVITLGEVDKQVVSYIELLTKQENYDVEDVCRKACRFGKELSEKPAKGRGKMCSKPFTLDLRVVAHHMRKAFNGSSQSEDEQSLEKLGRGKRSKALTSDLNNSGNNVENTSKRKVIVKIDNTTGKPMLLTAATEKISHTSVNKKISSVPESPTTTPNQVTSRSVVTKTCPNTVTFDRDGSITTVSPVSKKTNIAMNNKTKGTLLDKKEPYVVLEVIDEALTSDSSNHSRAQTVSMRGHIPRGTTTQSLVNSRKTVVRQDALSTQGNMGDNSKLSKSPALGFLSTAENDQTTGDDDQKITDKEPDQHVRPIASGCQDVCLVALDDKSASHIIQEHERVNKVKYVDNSTSPRTLTNLETLVGCKVYFEDKDFIAYDGMPYITLYVDVLQCQHQLDTPNGSINKGCEAKLWLKKVVCFPEFKIIGENTEESRLLAVQKLQQNFDTTTTQREKKILIRFEGLHKNHQAPGSTPYIPDVIDSRIHSKVRELLLEGFTDVQQVHQRVCDYGQELLEGIPFCYANLKRLCPSEKVVQNIMTLTKRRQAKEKRLTVNKTTNLQHVPIAARKVIESPVIENSQTVSDKEPTKQPINNNSQTSNTMCKPKKSKPKTVPSKSSRVVPPSFIAESEEEAEDWLRKYADETRQRYKSPFFRTMKKRKKLSSLDKVTPRFTERKPKKIKMEMPFVNWHSHTLLCIHGQEEPEIGTDTKSMENETEASVKHLEQEIAIEQRQAVVDYAVEANKEFETTETKNQGTNNAALVSGQSISVLDQIVLDNDQTNKNDDRTDVEAGGHCGNSKKLLGNTTDKRVKNVSQKKGMKRNRQGCSATILLKKVLTFPEYKCKEGESTGEAIQRLHDEFNPDTTVQKLWVYVYVQGEHSDHEHPCRGPLHPPILYEVRNLINYGETDVGEIQKVAHALAYKGVYGQLTNEDTQYIPSSEQINELIKDNESGVSLVANATQSYAMKQLMKLEKRRQIEMKNIVKLENKKKRLESLGEEQKPVEFDNDEDAYAALEQYELQNSVKFVKSSNHKNLPRRLTTLSKRKVMFDDCSILIPLENDGIPFVALFCDRLACVYGKDSKKAQKAKNPPRTLSTRTIKRDCPAMVRIRKIIKFPEYKVEKLTERNMVQKCRELRANFDPETTVQVYKVYLYIQGEHSNHQPYKVGNRLDSRICQRIKDLVHNGYTDIDYVRKQAYLFGKQLAGNYALPGDVRFFPSRKTVYNNMYSALSDNRYVGDCDNIEQLVENDGYDEHLDSDHDNDDDEDADDPSYHPSGHSARLKKSCAQIVLPTANKSPPRSAVSSHYSGKVAQSVTVDNSWPAPIPRSIFTQNVPLAMMKIPSPVKSFSSQGTPSWLTPVSDMDTTTQTAKKAQKRSSLTNNQSAAGRSKAKKPKTDQYPQNNSQHCSLASHSPLFSHSPQNMYQSGLEYQKVQEACGQLFQTLQKKLQRPYSIDTLIAVQKNLENLVKYMDKKKLRHHSRTGKKLRRTLLRQKVKRRSKAEIEQDEAFYQETMFSTNFLTEPGLAGCPAVTTSVHLDQPYHEVVVASSGEQAGGQPVSYATTGVQYMQDSSGDVMSSEAAASVLEQISQLIVQDGSVVIVQQ